MQTNVFVSFKEYYFVQQKQARKLQATLVRNYHSLTDGGEV